MALRRSGSSQARLAREADIDQSSISRYLRGQCEPNLRQFRAIAVALNVAPSFLLADDGLILRLAPSGRDNHYYAFREGKLVGEWTGESLDVFIAAEVVDGETADGLLATLKTGVTRTSRNGKNVPGPRQRRRRG